MAKELARELINAGVHFGHGVSRWNPKMAPLIYTKRGNIHIIDVRETIRGLLIAKKLLVEVVSSGKDVVFVGTKRQAQKAVETMAEKCGMHYISSRWLGGMLTNFRTIRSRLQRLEQLEAMQEDGTLDIESKKQASRLKREMRKIKSNLDGVRKMSRLPGAAIVVDAKREYLALREARKLDIPTIGLLDTDSDPDTVDVAIPANDDSIRAVHLLLGELADAVAIGKTMVGAQQEAVARPRRSRPTRRGALARASEEKPQAETSQDTAPATEAKPAEAVATVSQPEESKPEPKPEEEPKAAAQPEEAKSQEPEQAEEGQKQ